MNQVGDNDGQQVVTQQPESLGGAQQQQPHVGIPPGLEPLATTTQLSVKQEVEWIEILTGRKYSHHYSIWDEYGQKIYHAAEKSSYLQRKCCGANRAFDITVLDISGGEVMNMHRPFLCCGSCCMPCCLQRMQVLQRGLLLGSVRENISFAQSFSVRSAAGETQLKIRRGCWAINMCCSNVNFKIKSANGRHDVGLLTKQYRGIIANNFNEADTFTIQFPRDMNVMTKATVLGAVFLIDYLYFEEHPPK